MYKIKNKKEITMSSKMNYVLKERQVKIQIKKIIFMLEPQLVRMDVYIKNENAGVDLSFKKVLKESSIEEAAHVSNFFNRLQKNAYQKALRSVEDDDTIELDGANIPNIFISEE